MPGSKSASGSGPPRGKTPGTAPAVQFGRRNHQYTLGLRIGHAAYSPKLASNTRSTRHYRQWRGRSRAGCSRSPSVLTTDAKRSGGWGGGFATPRDLAESLGANRGVAKPPPQPPRRSFSTSAHDLRQQESYTGRYSLPAVPSDLEQDQGVLHGDAPDPDPSRVHPAGLAIADGRRPDRGPGGPPALRQRRRADRRRLVQGAARDQQGRRRPPGQGRRVPEGARSACTAGSTCPRC